MVSFMGISEMGICCILAHSEREVMLGVPEGCLVQRLDLEEEGVPVCVAGLELCTSNFGDPAVTGPLDQCQPPTPHFRLHGQPHPIPNPTWHASTLWILFSPKHLSLSQLNSLVLSSSLSLMLLPSLSACPATVGTPCLPLSFQCWSCTIFRVCTVHPKDIWSF